MPTTARFHLISGNRLDALAAVLGVRLVQGAQSSSGLDSLLPDTILVPQPSLRQWLQQTLAERYGIAANLDLPTPSEFVWRLLRAASETPLPEQSPWDRERLRWRLYALFERSTLQALPPAVRRYLQRSDAHSGDEGARALARLDLAERLADAFDRYQAYRRDWLEAWERGEDRDDWQAIVWRALRTESTSPHRAALIGDWLARYDRGGLGCAPGIASGVSSSMTSGAPPAGLPTRLSAFGTIHVSPDVLRMLAVAGQWCALDFYLPTPSAEYWGDVESLRTRLRRDGPAALPQALVDLQRDNPPLAAWGGGGREILAQLFSYDIVQPEAEIECFVDPGHDTLLHRLQQDVLRRAAPVAEAWSARDVSVQIHACHSKLREIEVLHDRLRAMLDDDASQGGRFDPPLQPHEIAVMAPNIGDYLPLARAVFGGLDMDDPRYIPYTLADRPQVQAHALIAWFIALLDLGDGPLRVGGFRDLIALPSVMHALGLSENHLARLDAWFAAAGIRWGEDAAARERAGVGRWREYSFDFGFERMLTGYAAGDDSGPWRGAAADDTQDHTEKDGEKHSEDHGEDHGEHQAQDNPWIAPYTELEGGDAEVLDRALEVYTRLRALAAWMRAPHTAGEWRQRLSESVVALIGTNAQDTAEAQARRWLLDAFDALAEDAAEAGALPLAVVRAALHAQLSQASTHEPWLAGGVTFAGMVPLRTVPFRVVCLLGLDADAYPRREPAQDIDRLVDAVQTGAMRRLGDRSVREDDRFLFLQWLCAANDVLYLSYGGRDARDGSVREPAAPIVELLDTIERMDGGCVDAHGNEGLAPRLAAHVRFEHPLQPFSPRAFGHHDGAEDPRTFSYRSEWRMDLPPTASLAAPPPFVAGPLPKRDAADVIASNEDENTPTRDSLQMFFANPAKAWLDTRLGLRFRRDDAGFDEREPMGENDLQQYQMIETLLAIEPASSPQLDGEETPLHTAATQNELLQILRARAALAPGRDGERLLEDALPVSQALRRAAQDALSAAKMDRRESVASQVPVAFAFDDVLRDAEGHPLRLIVEAGKLNGKRRLRAALDHLLLASQHGATARTVLIGQGKSKTSSKKAEGEIPIDLLVYGALDTESANARIVRLLALWREGRDEPLPFMPKAAWTYVDTLAQKKGDTDAAWRAADKDYGSEFGGEASDAYVALAFRPNGLFDTFDSPRATRFRALALAIFDDILPSPLLHSGGDRASTGASGNTKTSGSDTNASKTERATEKPARSRKKATGREP
jgi:exodeoxyribonuclease V gamma subunit